MHVSDQEMCESVAKYVAGRFHGKELAHLCLNFHEFLDYPGN